MPSSWRGSGHSVAIAPIRWDNAIFAMSQGHSFLEASIISNRTSKKKGDTAFVCFKSIQPPSRPPRSHTLRWLNEETAHASSIRSCPFDLLFDKIFLKPACKNEAKICFICFFLYSPVWDCSSYSVDNVFATNAIATFLSAQFTLSLWLIYNPGSRPTIDLNMHVVGSCVFDFSSKCKR